ncbi:InlB B-repeat-containing protein, partial [Enterococcus sp. MMGLQ5-1]|uniref:InlB B-repeat-containing protein n=2 Tax=unclassified Enterococcus TaxID=2608891 RepID=UPI0015546A43
TVLAGTTYPISTELPARVGYDFSGWQADDAAKTIYQPGASIVNVQAHITLTAQWSKPLKVSYAKGTSDLVIGLPPQATVRVGFDYQIPATEAPARIGYVFTGWQADDAAQTIYQAADTLEKLSRDTVLTAQWRKQYLIRYAKGTGDAVTGLPATSLVTAGADYQVATEIPTRAGYTFTGWQADDEGETVYQGSAVLVAIQCNHLLTAQWALEKAETPPTQPTEPSESQASEASKSSAPSQTKQQQVPHDKRWRHFSLPRTGEDLLSPAIGLAVIMLVTIILYYKHKQRNKD